VTKIVIIMGGAGKLGFTWEDVTTGYVAPSMSPHAMTDSMAPLDIVARIQGIVPINN
jgi:hypothetical protein